MKKQTIYAIALLCTTAFCGCTVTSSVVSYNAFTQAINEVNEAYKKEGFTLKNADVSNKREKPLSARAPQPYSDNEHGFHESTLTDIANFKTYQFVNEAGEKLSYTVMYRTGANPVSGLVYLREVSLDECKTSNPAILDRLCGKDAPIRKLENLEKDTTTVL